jgi:hypothetical protein
MHLYLIRHGQSYINLKEWQEGNVDAGLTELGQRQANALAAWRLAVFSILRKSRSSDLQPTRAARREQYRMGSIRSGVTPSRQNSGVTHWASAKISTGRHADVKCCRVLCIRGET